VKRHFLIKAHNTELWASYFPQLPGWSYVMALAGAGLLVGSFVMIPSPALVSRILLALAGLLLCLPLAIMANFAAQTRRRRTAVRQQLLDAVSWRGDELVLDVGCGSGMLLNGAAARLTTGQALGIDIWVEHGGGGSYELLMKHARRENVADRIAFEEVDARQMTFDDASFDVVLSSWAIHHIIHSREEFDNVVQEMLRVLKPGGTIVVLDIAHMLDALAIRFEQAGLAFTLTDMPYEQKMIVGRKLAA
jgi:SAM-dependent methyltransferase